MSTIQIGDTVYHKKKLLKKKKKSLQFDDQELVIIEPRNSASDEPQNSQDQPTKKKKKKTKSERVQTENEELRRINGLQFPESSEQSEGSSEIPKKKKKKKKSLQSVDQEMITVEPRNSASDEPQNSQDRPTKKKKKKTKSERVQTENEELRRINGLQFPESSEQSEGSSEIPKKKKKKKKSLQSVDQKMITVEPRISATDAPQNSQDRPTKKKKKKTKSERVQTENEDMGTIHGLLFPGSSELSEGSSETPKKKKKKKKETGDDGLCDVESSQELKINRKAGRGDAVLTEMHLNENVESSPTTLRKSKKRKRRKSCQSDVQESITIKSKTTAADEHALSEIVERVTFPSSKQTQLDSRKRKKKKKKHSENKQVEDEEESRGDNGLILQGRGEELKQMIDFTKMKKKKAAEEEGRLKVKGGGVTRDKVHEMCTHLNERVPGESPFTAHKKSTKRKRKNSIQSDGRELITGKPNSSKAHENVVVENEEGAMSPKKKRRRQRNKKKKRNDNEETEEELSQVNGSILPGSGELLEELTDIPKMKKKEDGRLHGADKIAEVKENGKAGRVENILTDMQLNEVVSNDENLEIASTALKKKKKKKKRKQSVESIDQDSISVEPQTTDEHVLVEDAESVMFPLSEQNGMKKKKSRASEQIEDEEELRTVNGSILSSDKDLEEVADISKKLKKKKKRKQYVESINQESIIVKPHTTDEQVLVENAESVMFSASEQIEDEEELRTVNGSILSSDEELGEVTEISKRKLKKKKKKNTEPCSHATRDDSDELSSQSEDNSVSEYFMNERKKARQDSELEAADGASSSSELLSDSDSDQEVLPDSAVPWLVKSERGFFMEHHIDLPLIHQKHHIYKKGRAKLRARGETVMEGKWSGLEETRLRENLKAFCKVYGIKDHLVLLLPNRYGLKRRVTRFWRRSKMLAQLAYGIPRTLNTVFLRAMKIFDPWHNLGHFSQAERRNVVRLEKKYGHQWQIIGNKMKRSSESVRILADSCKERSSFYSFHYGKAPSKGLYTSGKGKWKKFESQKLYDAVMEITAPYEGRLDRFVNVPWKTVAEIVKTRAAKTCHKKWMTSVSWRFNDRKRHTWEEKDYLDLIELVAAENAREEFEVNWVSIADKLSDRVASKSQMVVFWHKLVVKFVPNYFFMEYTDIIDTILDKAFPSLKEAAAKKEVAKAKIAKRKEKRESKIYVISDSEMSSEEDSADDWM